MQRSSRFLTDAIIAVIVISAVIYSTTLLAAKVTNSSIYRQSRIVSMLVQQESFDIPGMLEDTRNIELVVKFAGALATAYINFELIPVGEEGAFVAVFESLNDNVDIEGFEYHRKDLSITGTAVTKADYESFLETLRERKRFASVEGSCYDYTKGGVRFEILGISGAAEAYPVF